MLTADRERKADEQRWLEYRAHCLQEEEDEVMREALDESGPSDGNAHKRARVMVQVEGEGGRIVRSEIFNMVIKDGEALTYKIMVLPRDDPEVRRLRRQQAARMGEAVEESESEISGASAETLPVDHRGRVLPPPPEVPNDELDAFMRTEEGKEYYRQWLAGDQTCRMVRERSGCGLLAKFFQRKVEEDEEQKILQQALLAEAEAKKVNQGANGEGDPDCSTEKPKDENEEKLCGRPRSENDGLQGDHEQIQGEALSQGAEGSSTTVADADGKGQGLQEGRELAQGSRGPYVHHVQPGQEHDQGEEGQELAQGSGGPRAHHVQPGQEHGQGEDPRQELCDEQSALPRAPEHGLSEQGQRTRDEKPSDIAGWLLLLPGQATLFKPAGGSSIWRAKPIAKRRKTSESWTLPKPLEILRSTRRVVAWKLTMTTTREPLQQTWSQVVDMKPRMWKMTRPDPVQRALLTQPVVRAATWAKHS